MKRSIVNFLVKVSRVVHFIQALQQLSGINVNSYCCVHSRPGHNSLLKFPINISNYAPTIEDGQNPKPS